MTEDNLPKVGEIIRRYAGDIVASLEGDPDALANALDPVWTKAALGMHGNQFSLVRFARDIDPSSDAHARYYVTEYPFSAGPLRVTNDWYADQREAITDLLVERGILGPAAAAEATTSEAMAQELLEAPTKTSKPIAVGGTLRGYPIGNAQNLAVRTVLDLTGPAPTKEQWLETVEEFGSCCIYCEVEFSETVMPVVEHVVPINKTHLGENVIGNIVPACSECNSDKGGKELTLWLEKTARPIDKDAALGRVMAHRERHGYVPLIDRLGGSRAKVDEVIESMRAEMLTMAQRCAVLIHQRLEAGEVTGQVPLSVAAARFGPVTDRTKGCP